MALTPTVETILTERDFDQVWSYLESNLVTPKNGEMLVIITSIERERNIIYKPNPVADFLFFCSREINPLLNTALCRRVEHPTLMQMLYWMFKDRITKR